MSPRRKLPIGIQTFRKIREGGCYYVDKTAYAERLVEEGAHYFLSRSRRFGKSLFVDTLGELFEGSEAPFKGLDVHGRWDWPVRHPVLRLHFGAGNYEEPDYLREEAAAQLADLEKRMGIAPGDASAPIRFRRLIETLHESAGARAVILVDEYDKPILDALGAPEAARADRGFLRGLYSTIKQSDALVKPTFLTGVSKFSKMSLFSGLDNLTGITLAPPPHYSAICGYTDAGLDTVFAPELPGLYRDEIRRWYNGYRWLGEEKVYNPFDILLLFDSREFAAHWFRTGTPTLLVEALVRRGVSPGGHVEQVAEDEIGLAVLASVLDIDGATAVDILLKAAALGASLGVLFAGLVLASLAALNRPGARLGGSVRAVVVCASFAFRGHTLDEPCLVLGALVTLHVLGPAFWVGAFAPLHRLAEADAKATGDLAAEFGA